MMLGKVKHRYISLRAGEVILVTQQLTTYVLDWVVSHFLYLIFFFFKFIPT